MPIATVCTGLTFLLCKATSILNYVIPVLIALGMVYFIWGVIQYVVGGGEEAKTKGRNTMIFGIIGLAVIVAMWGLVYLIVNTFNLNNSNSKNYAPTPGELRSMLPQQQ